MSVLSTAPSTAIVGFPRWTPEADFVAGSFVTDYPAANLKRLPLSYPWRSVGLSAAATVIDIDFARPRKLGLLVLGPHNLSLYATIQTAVYYGAGRTDLMWDSGPQPVWPSVFSDSQVDWDGGRWWDRTYTPDEIQGYPWYRPTLTPTQGYALSARVTISDPANPDGFVQSGLLELASALRFPYNPDYGAQYGYRGRAITQESDGGTIHRRVRRKPRTFKGTVSHMPRDDALGSFLEMQRQLDVAQPFFWWPHPSDTRHAVRNAYLAHFTELDVFTYANFRLDGVPISLEEEL